MLSMAQACNGRTTKGEEYWDELKSWGMCIVLSPCMGACIRANTHDVFTGAAMVWQDGSRRNPHNVAGV
jgi:hypothetical protein